MAWWPLPHEPTPTGSPAPHRMAEASESRGRFLAPVVRLPCGGGRGAVDRVRYVRHPVDHRFFAPQGAPAEDLLAAPGGIAATIRPSWRRLGGWACPRRSRRQARGWRPPDRSACPERDGCAARWTARPCARSTRRSRRCRSRPVWRSRLASTRCWRRSPCASPSWSAPRRDADYVEDGENAVVIPAGDPGALAVAMRGC